MQIINFDPIPDKKKKETSWLLPDPLRCLLIAPAGSGKTNLLLNILTNDKIFTYDRLYIYSKTISQPKYQLLKDYFSAIEKETKEQMAWFFDDTDAVIEPEDLDKDYKNCMIFDDCQLESQKTICKYFVQGRHSNCSVFYCAQSFVELKKSYIRGNANFLIVFKVDKSILNLLYQQFVSLHMDKEKWTDFLSKCFRDKHDFISISPFDSLNDGFLRRSLDEFYIIK